MKVVKVLKYQNGRTPDGQPQTQMEVVVEETKVLGGERFDKARLYDLVADSEEPTAAMFLAMTDSLLARGERDRAEQTAKTVIKLSGGDRTTLMTLFVMLYKADMVGLAKKAVAAIDEATLTAIDESKARQPKRLLPFIGSRKKA
jgi:hypothetical protein